MVPSKRSTYIRIFSHKGFHVLALCPSLIDYTPPSTLTCALSDIRDEAVLELNFIGRFLRIQPLERLALQVRHDYLSDVASFLVQHQVCSKLSLRGSYGPRRPRQFLARSWSHLTSLLVCSPVMFGHHGRRLILSMCQSRTLRELALVDPSTSGRAWSSLLSRLSILNLRSFEINGRVSLKTVISFLDRHPVVASLTIGSFVKCHRWRPLAFALVELNTLTAPARLALPFLRVCPTLSFLDLKPDFSRGEPPALQDFNNIVLSLPGTGLRTLILDINEECMTALDAAYIPICLRQLTHCTLRTSKTFSPQMLVCILSFIVVAVSTEICRLQCTIDSSHSHLYNSSL